MTVKASRVDPNATAAALAVASFGRLTAILRPGARASGNLLDLYEPECGRYVESRPFPYATDGIAGIPGGIATLILDPIPHVAVLRWITK
jgi:hypothetical protein